MMFYEKDFGVLVVFVQKQARFELNDVFFGCFYAIPQFFSYFQISFPVELIGQLFKEFLFDSF